MTFTRLTKPFPKLLSTLLLGATILGIFPLSTQLTVSANDMEISYESQVTGIVFTPEEFNNAFAGELNTRFMPFNLLESELELRNIVIDGNSVRMDIVLTSTNLFNYESTTIFPIQGYIYNGNRKGALYIELDDFIDGTRIPLFEVNLMAGTHNLLLPNSKSQGLYKYPSTKLYMLDAKGMLNLFEFNTPIEFKNLDPYSFPELMHMNDITWAREFVDYEFIEFEEEELTLELLKELGVYFYDVYEQIVPFGNGTFTNHHYGSGAFSWTFTLGNERSQSTSRPILRRRHNNIGAGATNVKDVEFRIAEVSRIWYNGIQQWERHDRNTFNYREVEVRIQVGQHTQINNMSIHGGTRRHSTGAEISGAVLNTIQARILHHARIPGAADVNAAINLVGALANQGSRNISLGGSGFSARTGRWSGAGTRFEANYRFSNHTRANGDGHRLHLQIGVGRNGDTANSTSTESGAVMMGFYVFDGNTRIGNRRNMNVGFTYTINRR